MIGFMAGCRILLARSTASGLAAQGGCAPTRPAASVSEKKAIGIVLYPGFEMRDVFGP